MPELAERLPVRVVRPHRGAIPLADAAALRRALRRTTLIRVVLGVSLVLLATGAVWRAAGLNPRPVAFLPESSTTVVVLDQSKSVYLATYRRIATLFRKLVQVDVPIGLVAFSDTAYEMLPPGAHSSELKPLLRFYLPSRTGSNIDPSTMFATAPWDNVFSGGTRISGALDLARSLLHRDHVRHGTILLVSDLETASEDLATLAQSLQRINNDHSVQLRIVPLFPVSVDQQFFERFVSPRDFVKPSEYKATGPATPRRKLLARTPWSLLVIAALLFVALAVNELLCARLHVPPAPAGEAA